jgi:hypothetical protein
MAKHEIIARMETRPRRVEIEIEAPVGTPVEERLRDALQITGTRMLDKSVFRTTGQIFVGGSLLEPNGEVPELRRASLFVDVLNQQLSAPATRGEPPVERAFEHGALSA